MTNGAQTPDTPSHDATRTRARRSHNSREHILDAYISLLIRSGERAATLDAVAAAAKVSKGGLLYHFGSKKALVAALAERALRLAKEDQEAMAAAPEGASTYYLTTSVPDDSPFDAALIALSRLAQDDNAQAGETLARIQDGWYSLLLGDLGEERLARAVLLMGDGMYYHASFLEGQTREAALRQADRDREALLWVLDLMKASRAG